MKRVGKGEGGLDLNMRVEGPRVPSNATDGSPVRKLPFLVAFHCTIFIVNLLICYLLGK